MWSLVTTARDGAPLLTAAHGLSCVTNNCSLPRGTLTFELEEAPVLLGTAVAVQNTDETVVVAEAEPLQRNEGVPRPSFGRRIAPAVLALVPGVVAEPFDPRPPSRPVALGQVGSCAGVRPEMATRNATTGAMVRTPAEA